MLKMDVEKSLHAILNWLQLPQTHEAIKDSQSEDFDVTGFYREDEDD